MLDARPAPILGAVLLLAAACVQPPPFVVLSIEDPSAVASSFVTLHLGLSRDALSAVPVSASSFPLAVTVTAKHAGEMTLWVEARSTDGSPLARGKIDARFARAGTPTATIRLAKACDADALCDDGQFCTGVETCDDGMCASAAAPCAANVECVTSTCVEFDGGTGACDTVVHHESCGIGSYCNPIRGCVEGQGCLQDTDCNDGFTCNGVERCINLVCALGIPPTVSDGDACTLDGCDDARTALSEEAVFHVALESFDGRPCVISGSGAPGVCVSTKHGCVTSACGDGVVAQTEACEDGNLNPNDGCDTCKRTRWTSVVLVGRGEGQGQAAAVALVPAGVAIDRRGNLLITDGNRIRRIDAMTHIITTVAGSGVQGFSGDGGTATSATLAFPGAVSVDGSGNVFIADSGNNRIRRVEGQSGVITTVAGGGSPADGLGDGGPATSASLSPPFGVGADGAGNLFIADALSSRVRRVDGQSGVITTVAGTGAPGFFGDGGPATSAMLYSPSGVTTDAFGNLFIADSGIHDVRRVDASGVITTVAGIGTPGFSGDGGAATGAALDTPFGLSVDGPGNLFIADVVNNRIRRVDWLSGVITTVAGSAGQGFSGDGGAATSATLFQPYGVVVDAGGNLFIADGNNNRIRRVDGASGVISTVAGTGPSGFLGDGGVATSANFNKPYVAAVDGSGNLFIADDWNHRIRRVDGQSGVTTTVAGTGTAGFSGDGGPATSAEFYAPQGVGVDGSGNLFIADTLNSLIRRVDGQSGVITTVAGGGSPADGLGDGTPATTARLAIPFGLDVDGPGNIFIADTWNHRIRRVDGTSGIITTLAGTGVQGFSGDGNPATGADLDGPSGVRVDGSGNLFITDRGNSRIRRVDSASGFITTVAGTGAPTFSGDGGAAMSAALNLPFGVGVDGSGDLFIADTWNHRIRRVDGQSGIITTAAGTGVMGFSGDGGPAANATLNNPNGVSVDGAGNLFIADTDNNCVRRVDRATGVITTVAGSVFPAGDGRVVTSVLGAPRALVRLVAGTGSWLVADGASGRVRALDLDSGWVSTPVGYLAGFGDEGAAARYSRLLADPRGIAHDAVGGTVFVSESGGHTIRAIDVGASPWTISTLAGALDSPGFRNAAGTGARFANPSGLLWKPTTRTLLVADAGNHVIRAVNVDSGATTTVAGTPRYRGYFGEGVPATTAFLNGPEALALGNDGSLYVADTGNNRVRRVDTGGLIDTILGDGTAASSGEGGPARYFPVDEPVGLAVDSFGNLFVSSSTALRVVTAGADNLATGEDEVMTIYGRSPRETFPEPVTFCLAGIAVLDGSGGAKDGRLYVLDACAGFMLQLDRETM